MAPDRDECVLAREVYEHACLISIEAGDVDSFERHFKSLKFYYNELWDVIPDSENRNILLGLWLLRLLSSNQFHSELQAIPMEEHKDPYINIPVSLEMHFNDGNYNKILATKQDVNRDEYNFFIDKFIDTVRSEIARSAEVSYKSLSIRDALDVFLLQSESELLKFVEKEGSDPEEEKQYDWEVKDGSLHFIPKVIEKSSIPSHEMMFQSLDYAKELERII